MINVRRTKHTGDCPQLSFPGEIIKFDVDTQKRYGDDSPLFFRYFANIVTGPLGGDAESAFQDVKETFLAYLKTN